MSLEKYVDNVRKILEKEEENVTLPELLKVVFDGLEDASETYNVTLELVKRGYSEEEIAKIWSGNLLRVLDKNQEIAIQLQNTD